MGAWGTAVFSDDFACDVKDQFRDFLAETDDTSEAIIKMKDLHAESLEDSDDGPVFWIALAATAWKLGRLDESTKQQALTVIESGADLQRWEDDSNSKKRRGKVLERLAQQLQTVQRQPVKIRKRWTAENDCAIDTGRRIRSDSAKTCEVRAIRTLGATLWKDFRRLHFCCAGLWDCGPDVITFKTRLRKNTKTAKVRFVPQTRHPSNCSQNLNARRVCPR